MRRAPLQSPFARYNFMMAVWRAQAEAKFPHPANWRERRDWAFWLCELHRREVRHRRRLVNEAYANENAGTRPALGSTMRLGSPWFDGR